MISGATCPVCRCERKTHNECCKAEFTRLRSRVGRLEELLARPPGKHRERRARLANCDVFVDPWDYSGG